MTTTAPALYTLPVRRILIVIFLLCVILRLLCWNLADTVYRDTVRYAQEAATFRLDSTLRSPLQEPLYPVLLFLAHAVCFPHAGPSAPVDPFRWETIAFLVGLFFSIGTVWVGFLLGRRLHSEPAGLWTALFLAAQPFGILYAINGLTETVYVFFLLSFLLLVLLAPPYRLHFFFVGMAMLIPLLVRKDGIILPGVLILYLLVLQTLRLTQRIHLVLVLLAGFLFAGVLYRLLGGHFYWLPWEAMKVPDTVFRRITGTGSDGAWCLAMAPLSSPGWLPWLLFQGWFKLAGFFPALLYLVYMVRPRRLWETRNGLLVELVILFQIFLCAGYAIYWGTFTTRYLFSASVMAFPLAAAVLTVVVHRCIQRFGNPRMIILSVAIVLLATWSSMVILSSVHHRLPGIRSAAQWVSTHTPPHSFLLTNDSRIGFYSHRGNMDVTDYLFADVISSVCKSKDRPCYLALDFHGTNEGELNQRLEERAKENNFKPVPVASMNSGKNKITIFVLQFSSPAAGTHQ